MRCPLPGCSDRLDQFDSGRLLACEVKAPSTRPTMGQAAFLEQVGSHDGLACVLRGVHDVQRALVGCFA